MNKNIDKKQKVKNEQNSNADDPAENAIQELPDDDKRSNKPVSMDDLTAGEAMPEVRENAIEAVQSQKQIEMAAAKADGFDPDIHMTDGQGQPIKTKGGAYRKKPGVKKSGSKSVVNTGQKSAKEIQAQMEAEKTEAENLQSAVVVSGILENLQMKLISEEFKYDDLERRTNVENWKATFEHYGGVNISPPVALAMDHATIILKRSQMKETSSRFALAKTWLKNKFSFIKRKRENALSDSGQNVERKNDVRKEESARS